MDTKLLTGTEEIAHKVNASAEASDHLVATSTPFWAVVGLALACLVWGRRIKRMLT